MKCKICSAEMKNLLALSTHIQFKHGNKKQEYYDLYMKKEGESFCKICGKPTKFRIFSTGYEVYCSKECEKIDYSNRMKNQNPMKNQKSKDNQRKTNQERYGANQNTQRSGIKEKVKNTNLEKYGVDNVSKVKKIMDKAKKSRTKTCMEQYGVPSYFMVESVKDKMRSTSMKHYGVPYPIQNPEVFLKNQKSGFRAKPFGNIYYRGSYELNFLEKYYYKFKMEQGLSFPYFFDKKNRVYHSDFYLPELNLIIEIKNQYAYNRYKKIILAKKEAVIAAGYKFILIIDKKYDEFEQMMKIR